MFDLKKLSEGSAQPKGSLSGAARRDGGCVSKHDKFHRDGTVQPTAKLALTLCIALDKKFEELFTFNWIAGRRVAVDKRRRNDK